MAFCSVNHMSTTLELSSSCMYLNPMSQVSAKPCLAAANSAMLFDASPKCRENPEIHSPQWFRKMPPASASPGLLMALPLVFSLI